mmetsp:Transcript_6358/g.23284  ORF Transcript_6358/g.23284 Transcript_6358/m.23284 type:complete len:354 (+) Transcript_6358:248-1309(+)
MVGARDERLRGVQRRDLALLSRNRALARVGEVFSRNDRAQQRRELLERCERPFRRQRVRVRNCRAQRERRHLGDERRGRSRARRHVLLERGDARCHVDWCLLIGVQRIANDRHRVVRVLREVVVPEDVFLRLHVLRVKVTDKVSQVDAASDQGVGCDRVAAETRDRVKCLHEQRQSVSFSPDVPWLDAVFARSRVSTVVCKGLECQRPIRDGAGEDPREALVRYRKVHHDVLEVIEHRSHAEHDRSRRCRTVHAGGERAEQLRGGFPVHVSAFEPRRDERLHERRDSAFKLGPGFHRLHRLCHVLVVEEVLDHHFRFRLELLVRHRLRCRGPRRRRGLVHSSRPVGRRHAHLR